MRRRHSNSWVVSGRHGDFGGKSGLTTGIGLSLSRIPAPSAQDADYPSNRVWVVSDDYLPGDAVRLYNASFAPPLGATQGAFTVLAVAPASADYRPPKNASHTMPNQKFTAATRYLVLTLREVRFAWSSRAARSGANSPRRRPTAATPAGGGL